MSLEAYSVHAGSESAGGNEGGIPERKSTDSDGPGILVEMESILDMTGVSDRLQMLKPSSTLAVTARVAELKSQGHDVIGFGAGQPDFDTPDNIKNAAIEALRAGKTKYAPTPGVREARETIARKLCQENGIECSSDDVVITVGAKHALYMTLQGVVNPGNQVILATPCWVSYRPMVELAGGSVVEVAGSVERDFKITPDKLDAAIGKQTAAFLINSPSNPCGTMYSEQELRDLAAVLVKYPHVTVITDEIYEKIIFGGIKHFSLGSMPELADQTVTINGLSKAFAMTGWRAGYLCAPGRGGLLARSIPRLQDQMTSCITSFTYPAIVEALENGAEAVEKMRQAFSTRAELIYNLVSQIPDLPCPRPTGAFYLFPDVSAYLGRVTEGGRKINTSLDFAEALLDEAGVAVVSGEDFGKAGETHIRLSFACSEENIQKGCQRIDRWLRGFR